MQAITVPTTNLRRTHILAKQYELNVCGSDYVDQKLPTDNFEKFSHINNDSYY